MQTRVELTSYMGETRVPVFKLWFVMSSGQGHHVF